MFLALTGEMLKISPLHKKNTTIPQFSPKPATNVFCLQVNVYLVFMTRFLLVFIPQSVSQVEESYLDFPRFNGAYKDY